MKNIKQWIALCQTCNWSGARSKEDASPKQEKANHLKNHPTHNVRVLVTGG
jgi:hypothetical protein